MALAIRRAGSFSEADFWAIMNGGAMPAGYGYDVPQENFATDPVGRRQAFARHMLRKDAFISPGRGRQGPVANFTCDTLKPLVCCFKRDIHRIFRSQDTLLP